MVAKRTTHSLQLVKRVTRLDFGGTVLGLIFFCLSFTPSLLPRGYVVQGIAAGLSFVTGYIIGVIISYAASAIILAALSWQ